MAGHIVFERSEKISDFSPARERTKKNRKKIITPRTRTSNRLNDDEY
tara:strand:- start:1655 stop:1795 length:141 start_codon:yes stop_codon:yes gene_type:complete